MKCPNGRTYSDFSDPNFTVLTEFMMNDHLTRILRMAQDTIEVLKVLFPKKSFDKQKIIRI